MSDEMEKYAVVTDEDSTKTAKNAAGVDRDCPTCGLTLEAIETTGVLKCPKCGTKPFERGDG